MMRNLRAHNIECFGWNRSSTTVGETTKGGFDTSINPQAMLERAEVNRALIAIDTPITAVGTMLNAINEHTSSCGITDIVSVKATVAAEVSARGMEEHFIDTHPMAGSAQAGWSATLGGLFDGAPWVITYDLAAVADATGKPIPERWVEVFSQVTNPGAALGSQLIPALSDHRGASVARISYMPHLAAYAVATAGKAGGPLAISLAADSFRDCTYVTTAAPDMVMSWCESNTEPVFAALGNMIERLTTARTQSVTEGTAMNLAKIGQTAHVCYEVRPIHRPILRLRVGESDWINQLKLAESIGGQVDVFQYGTIFSSELHTSLVGTTVVNFAINVSGPLAAQYLGWLGARVIKVEPPTDDPLGAFGRPWYGAMSAGHGIIRADLRSDEGRTQLSSLIDEANVIIISVRPSALERMGLAELHERPNGPVHIDVVGDTDAPEAPGHNLTYQAEAGTLTPPAVSPVLLGDILDTHLAVTAALAELVKRVDASVDVVRQPGLHCCIGLKQVGEAGAAPLRYGMTAPDGLLGGGLWTYGLCPSADGCVVVTALEPYFTVALTEATGASSRGELAVFLGERTNAEIMRPASEKTLPLAVVG